MSESDHDTQIIKTEQSPHDGGDARERSPAPVISAHDVHFRYSKKTPLLFEGLNLSMYAGDHVALTGPSGRGKSTLLYLLAGLTKPSKGTIAFGDTDLFRVSDTARSRLRMQHFGFVFQNAELDPRRRIIDSVLEPARYLGLPAKVSHERAGELLDVVGLGGRFDDTPRTLSGGQCQRVAVARAMMTDPDVIFADEPTGNLDEHTSIEVLNALFGLAEHTSVIVATHDSLVMEHTNKAVQL